MFSSLASEAVEQTVIWSVVDAKRFMQLLTWVAKFVGKEKERNPLRAIEYIDPSSGKEVAELKTAVGWKGRLGNQHYMLDLPFFWPLLWTVDSVWPPDPVV